jgi:hypothetical protein
MNLTPFRNNLAEVLELGDVVVIGKGQASPHDYVSNGILVPEVEFAQVAYDTRVCGIVCQVHVQPELENKERLEYSAKAEKSANAKTIKHLQKTKASPAPDRTKIEPGQLGYMVTQGAFACCKVDADISAIQVGDLLTTSPTKGHAQKALDASKLAGAILGKALGSLKKGKGKIPVLVVS